MELLSLINNRKKKWVILLLLFHLNNFSGSAKVHPESSSEYLLKANRESVNYLNCQATACFEKGTIYKAKNITDSAFLYFIKAQALFSKAGDYSNLIKTKVALAEYYRGTYLLYKATSIARNAIELSLKHKIYDYLPYAYNRLGAIYFERSVNNSKVNTFYNDTTIMAVTFVDSSEYWGQMLHSTKYKVSNYNILGACYKNLHQNNKAIHFLSEAIVLAYKTNSIDELPMLYRNVGANYLEKGTYEKAIVAAKKGIYISDSLRFNNGLWQNQYLLFTIYEKLKNYSGALFALKKADSLQLIVFNEGAAARTREYEAKFKNRESSLIIQSQHSELSKQRLKLVVTFLISVLSLITILIGIFLFRKIRKKNEELKKNNLLLKTKQDKINELINVKDDLMSMIVHDLKNPLNTIVNLSSINKANVGVINTINHSERIRAISIEMINMINNIIDVKRMEESEIKLNYSLISINKLIKAVTSEFEIFTKSKNIHVSLDFRSEVQCFIDESWIKRALANVFSNAIKFTPNNGKITVEISVEDTWCILKILDNGPGIPNEKISLLFNKYSRAEIRDFEYSGSVGLGLAFAKIAVNAHDGKVDVISECGKGACFRFFLPLKSSSINLTPSTENIEEVFSPVFNLEIGNLKRTLLQYQYFETGELLNIIYNYKCNHKQFDSWKQQVEDAILNSNKEKFNDLVKI